MMSNGWCFDGDGWWWIVRWMMGVGGEVVSCVLGGRGGRKVFT